MAWTALVSVQLYQGGVNVYCQCFAPAILSACQSNSLCSIDKVRGGIIKHLKQILFEIKILPP